jgi:hypothetical protein
MKKVDIFGALGRDETWFANAEVFLKLAHILGEGGIEEEPSIVDMLSVVDGKPMGLGKMLDKLKEAARRKKLAMFTAFLSTLVLVWQMSAAKSSISIICERPATLFHCANLL